VIKKLDLEKQRVVAFSDSIADLPLLEMAGKAMVIRPDRELYSLSKQKGWEILT